MVAFYETFASELDCDPVKDLEALEHSSSTVNDGSHYKIRQMRLAILTKSYAI